MGTFRLAVQSAQTRREPRNTQQRTLWYRMLFRNAALGSFRCPERKVLSEFAAGGSARDNALRIDPQLCLREPRSRSEERRVGKEGGGQGRTYNDHRTEGRLGVGKID